MTIHWCGTGLSAIPGLKRLLEAGYEVVGEKPGDGKPKRYRISATPAQTGETTGAEATDAR